MNDSIDGAEEVVKTLHVEREDDSKFKQTRQSPKCAVTNCNRWSCVALLNDRIDGAEEAVKYCTWKEKTSKNL